MEINILGYGVMGRQISSVLILSGYKVNILSRKDIPEDKIKRNVKIISRLLSLEIKSLVFELYTDINDLPNNLTIECIDENLDKKIEIYENISKKNDKPYITNTSSFSPSEINKNIW